MNIFRKVPAIPVIKLLSSRYFFRFVIVLLVVQAAWVAFSARYPMAFDEDFHLGIIKLYAHHLSPFWSSQPANADTFGAVARDPSYLYQYLMSFPYRLVNLFTHDQTIIVICLRLLNISLFAGGLYLYRNLLLKVGGSRAAANFCLLVFVLLPIVPLLASQINYDNLLLPLVAAALLTTWRLNQALGRRQIDLSALLGLVIICFLSCIVKYAFLPIALAMLVFILVRLVQVHKSVKLLEQTKLAWKRMATWLRAVLLIGAVLSAGLFSQRIVVNLVRYHTPVPDCQQVLTVKQCSHYGPWIRDYEDQVTKLPGKHDIATYTKEWFYGMWLRTFFAVGGPNTDFETRGPLTMPGIAGAVFAGLGFIVLVTGFKRLRKHYDQTTIWLLASVAVVYVVFLWLDEYKAYIKTGQPVAINGRYLLPILPLVFSLVVLSTSQLLQRRKQLQTTAASVLIICLLWGGGAMTFILRSRDAWYWPSPAVRSANHAVQRIAGPLTPGYSKPTAYLR